jgi:hypothetical protein
MSCLGIKMPRMMAGFSAGRYILAGIRASLSEQRNIPSLTRLLDCTSGAVVVAGAYCDQQDGFKDAWLGVRRTATEQYGQD